MKEAYQVSRLTIKQWNDDDKPREKLVQHGRRFLTEAELIAILIGSGNHEETAVDLSKRILADYNNDLDALGKASVQDLSRYKGIGEAKAVSIVAAMELGRRRKETDTVKKLKIEGSKTAYELMYPLLMDLPHEEFWVLYLNRSNSIIAKEKISIGGINGTIADLRMIFKKAVDHLSCGIILVHNHPSGNLRPSASDKHLTNKMKEAGKLLDIPVLDHIIFTEAGYFSFADENLI